jgi:hypothetical protein
LPLHQGAGDGPGFLQRTSSRENHNLVGHKDERLDFQRVDSESTPEYRVSFGELVERDKTL